MCLVYFAGDNWYNVIIGKFLFQDPQAKDRSGPAGSHPFAASQRRRRFMDSNRIVDSSVKCAGFCPLQQQKGPEGHPPADDSPPIPNDTFCEVGLEKDSIQHAGNATFGTASVAALTSNVGELAGITGVASRIPGSRLIPGLNLLVVGVESYNAARKLAQGDHLVAATHAGNASGCMGAFLSEGKALNFASKVAKVGRMSALAGVGAGLGFVGGVLGIAAGQAEIRQGLKNVKAGGTNRTLMMGILDVTSGVTSAIGSILLATGIGGPLGLGLLMVSGACDLAGIGADYLGARKAFKEKQARESATASS
jgi:hypothetical protein